MLLSGRISKCSKLQLFTKLAKGNSLRNLQTLELPDTVVPFNHSEYIKQYRKGDELFGFVLKDISEVEELHLTALRLQHRKTGAEYLHVARNDMNNVFSVVFRTPPPDSTGVCHILEHLALAGSQAYPCRDPFFKMLNRSLSTFMNAFTGTDYTMYPFSTQNFNDYNNLMNVYLDAAFFPLLRQLDFHQEGWRLEHEDVENDTTPIILKGVVFNEMKGVFASSAYHFYENQLNKIFPNNAYRYVSGGDPLDIPKLSWQQLKEYHKTFYHPSNARFFSYGNFPLESHLSNLDSWILSKFSKSMKDTSVQVETRWEKPRESKIKCGSDPMAANPEKQTTVSLTYLLDNVTNTYESFALAILSNLLMDGASSPFYKSLLLPGIGADYSPGSGYSAQNQQGLFSVGLTGINESDVEAVKARIDETFDAVIKDGFPKERIEAVLHSVELGNKHQTENFGLHIIMSINPSWNHGGDPITSLQINKHVNWFREQLAKDSRMLEKKIEKYFKKNNHKLVLVMNPDESFGKENEEKEAQLLYEKIKNLSEKDKRRIFSEGKELANFQRLPVDSTCLPTLLIAEVNPKVETNAIIKTCIETVPVFTFQEPTNGVTYFRSVLNTANLSDDLQPYLPLFCSVLTQMGAGSLNYMQQDQEINLHTGGLNAKTHITDHAVINGQIEQGVILSSYCLERNTAQMFTLWLDIFEKLSLGDEDRLAQLIRIEASDLVQGLASQGHMYAMLQANHQLTASSALKELQSGLTHVTHQKKLAELSNYSEIVRKLKAIASQILNKSQMRCSLHVTPAHSTEAKALLSSFLLSLTGSGTPAETIYCEKHVPYDPHNSHFVMPFPVNYVAKGLPTIPYAHSDYAPLRVMSKLVSSKYLHREIREVGGAYGSGATLSQGGIWTFYSYRDPNVENTLNAFSSSIDWLSSGKFTEQDIDEAKLGIFSEVDKPVAPGNKGLSLFFNGIDDQQRQQHKDKLFLVSKSQIQEKAEQYLSRCEKFGVAVVGPRNEFTSKDNWKVITES